MKTLLHAFCMCQSMFCALPAPQLWDEQAKDKMLLFLPLVGLELGGIWAAAAWACRAIALPGTVTALIECILPYLVTGFLHLDGFMDVTDALRSYRSPERRREILKDPHVGSFAVIGAVMLILSAFALFAAAKETANILILLFIPAVSRCGSALAVMALPPMQTSQYAGRKKRRGHIAAVSGMLAVLLAAGFFLCGRYGFALLAGMAGYALALARGYRHLQGMNGDIAGYALSLSELCAVAAFALL